MISRLVFMSHNMESGSGLVVLQFLFVCFLLFYLLLLTKSSPVNTLVKNCAIFLDLAAHPIITIKLHFKRKYHLSGA